MIATEQGCVQMKPKRVLVFTTPLLLKMFRDNDGSSSVDGTFKITRDSGAKHSSS